MMIEGGSYKVWWQDYFELLKELKEELDWWV